MRHIGQELSFGLRRRFGDFLCLAQIPFGSLLCRDVLIGPVHEERPVCVFLPDKLSGRMDPDDLSVDWALVGVNRIVMLVFAVDGALISFGRAGGGFGVGFFQAFVPFVGQMVATIGLDGFAQDTGGSFRLEIVVGVAVINDPIAASRELQGDIGKEVGTFDFGFQALARGDVAKDHDSPDKLAILAYWRGCVFHRDAEPILGPQDFGIDRAGFSIMPRFVHRTVFQRIFVTMLVLMMDQGMQVLSDEFLCVIAQHVVSRRIGKADVSIGIQADDAVVDRAQDQAGSCFDFGAFAQFPECGLLELDALDRQAKDQERGHGGEESDGGTRRPRGNLAKLAQQDELQRSL